MLCIGAGGMDVAAAMTGLPMGLSMPRVIRVYLTGRPCAFFSHGFGNRKRQAEAAGYKRNDD